ncbi:MAG: DUF4118 domain-containing protein [Ruminococcaceae bacterium]|nr:DUF4118 domain-containing protein [Oscillospiraceae bacterium]
MKTDNHRLFFRKYLSFSWHDTLITLLIMSVTTVFCLYLRIFHGGDSYMSGFYILSVFLIARSTSGYLYSVFSSFLSVILVNYLFTYPYFSFNFTLPGYPLMIMCMLIVAVITGMMTSQLMKQNDLRIKAEKEKTRGNLLRAVSHDLRTPLTSILGASSTLMENDASLDPAERRLLLAGIKDDAQWLIRMVENLLSVTRIDGTSSTRITKTEEPAEEVIDESLQKFHKRFPDTEVQVSIPDELIMIPMDPLLIEQVIINLLENAALHAGSAVHIHIKLESQQDFALFTVSDDGRGIDPRILPHIFESGIHTIDAERSDQRRNMGIGLSVCDTIIRAHGGQMHAANADEGGAVFTFTLPIEEAHV